MRSRKGVASCDLLMSLIGGHEWDRSNTSNTFQEKSMSSEEIGTFEVEASREF